MVLRYMCVGDGIGYVPTSLASLGIYSTCVGICESDIHSLLAYYCTHSRHIKVAIPRSRHEICQKLLPCKFTTHGKNVDIDEIPDEPLTELYTAHVATKNMGALENIQSLPTTCDLLVILCRDVLQQLQYVTRILHSTPDKPKFLLLETLPKYATALVQWKKDLYKLGYTSLSKTLKSTHCGIPISKSRHFIISNMKFFSARFSSNEPPIEHVTNFLRAEGIDSYKTISLINDIPTQNDTTPFVELEGHKIFYLNGILPGDDCVKIVHSNTSARYLTPLEHWLLSGFEEKHYMAVKLHMPNVTPVTLINLCNSSVYLFCEIFRHLFISPICMVCNTITIPSTFLGFNIKYDILQLLREKYENKCFSKLHGYIIEVINIDRIHGAYVSKADCSNRIRLSYSIKCVKPRLNNIYTGNVKACYQTGILCDIKIFAVKGFDCNVLVISDLFDKKTKTSKFSTCKCSFFKGCEIKFQISELDYNMNSNTFVCVGRHKC